MRKHINFLINYFRKHIILFLSLSLLVFWLIYSYYTKGIFYSVVSNDVDKVVNYIQSLKPFSAFFFIFLVTLESVVAPIPPFLLYFIGGLIFGPLIGGIFALIGNVLGAMIAFTIARTFRKDFIEEKIPEKIRKKFDTFSEKYGTLSLFLLRLNPFTSSDLFSYVAGFTKMSIKSLIICTGLGLAPIIFLQTFFGGIMYNHPIFLTIVLIVSLLYLIVFIYGIIYLIIKRFNNRNKTIN